ncbi:pickpocket protein 28-like [Vanessa cardui]|uniref:pickpocket protein 28-like n=1 Tax=Vanessa cardui TaxID=171605 RepID=UPI001F12A39D|nr:pickpocket protein 28-like [Vanessa cardui]
MKFRRNKRVKGNKFTSRSIKHLNNCNRSLKKQNLVQYIRNELATSTTHGLSYFVKKRIHYLEKLFWIGNFVACVVLAALLLNVQYRRFIAAPTVMSVEMNYFDWNISYPAVTLCPLYKPDVKKFHTYINQTYNYTGLHVEGYLWAISQAALDTLEYMDLNIPEDVIPLIHPKDYATLAASMFRKFENTWLTTNTNWSITVDAAMTEMGMCHVINSNVAIYDKPHHWNDKTPPPPYVKSNMELSVFEANFVTEITNFSSIYKKYHTNIFYIKKISDVKSSFVYMRRTLVNANNYIIYIRHNLQVFIHSPDEVTTSTTSSFGFDVEGIISFGLSVWSSRISETLRYKSLHLRKCRFPNEPISKRYPIYSYSHCMLECRIKVILKLCGCVPHFYKPLEHERTCRIAELQCVLRHRRAIVSLRGARGCACAGACELDLYYKDTEDFEPTKGFNRLILKITSFPRVRVVRDVIFSSADILLRSGGVVNLCIGCSVVSVVEFLLVIFKIVLYVIVKALGRFKTCKLATFRRTKKKSCQK